MVVVEDPTEPINWIDADGAYLLLKALRSDDAIIRRRAAAVLGDVDPDNFRQLAELALASDDVLVRRSAADALDRRMPE